MCDFSSPTKRCSVHSVISVFERSKETVCDFPFKFRLSSADYTILSADYRLFLDLAEQGIKSHTAKQLRMMELAKWIMGER